MSCPLCISQHCHDNQNLDQVMTKTKTGRAWVKNRTRPAGPTLHDTIQIKCQTCKAEALLKMIGKIHITNTENKQRFLPLICFIANPVLYVYTKIYSVRSTQQSLFNNSFWWFYHLRNIILLVASSPRTIFNHRMYTLILLQLSSWPDLR